MEGQVGVGGIGGSNPAWVATAQRVLEQSATQLTAPPGIGTDEEQALMSGRKAALRFVSQALAQHLSNSDVTPDAATEAPGLKDAVPTRARED